MTRPATGRHPTWRWGNTAVITLALGLLAAWLATGPAAAAVPVHHLADSLNPLEGVKPDFSLVGPTVGKTWRRFAAAFWAICLAACAVWLIAATVKMASANNRGFAGQQVEAKKGALDALTGFAACLGVSILIGAVIFVMGV